MTTKAVAVLSQTPKVIPPSSPFGELLRRSNFASYDPAIRQTYAAPPSYVQRGNWGLKRPIANKHRKSAIVLRNFEEHAHYIEWDNATAQVDLVRRIEDLNVRPTVPPTTSWALGLGPDAELIDSEFSPHEWDPEKARLKAEERKKALGPEAAKEQVEPASAAETTPEPSANSNRPISLRGVPSKVAASLGSAGQGNYGSSIKVPEIRVDENSYIQPNIAAMTPVKFEAYLSELRELRPQFLQYVRQEMKKGREAAATTQGAKESEIPADGIDPDSLTDEELILNLGVEAAERSLHRYFLGLHANNKMNSYREQAKQAEANTPEAVAALANTSQPIEPMPHRSGGLVYSKPTLIETYHIGRPEPGLVWQDINKTAWFHKGGTRNGYVAAFAGMNAWLIRDKAGNNTKALFDPFTDEGVVVPREPGTGGKPGEMDLTGSAHPLRLVDLKLEMPPKVIGRHVPNRTLEDVHIDATVVNGDINANKFDNPYRPGTRRYIDCVPTQKFTKGASEFASTLAGFKNRRAAPQTGGVASPTPTPELGTDPSQTEKAEGTIKTINTLQKLLNMNNTPNKD